MKPLLHPHTPPPLRPANERRSSKSSLKPTQLLTAEQIDRRRKESRRGGGERTRLEESGGDEGEQSRNGSLKEGRGRKRRSDDRNADG